MCGKALAEAARLLAVLWAFTCLAYFFHPQGAIPLFSFFGLEGKLPSVLAGLIASTALWFFPGHRLALAVAALVSGATVLSWHSWLGAYQPLVPVAFLFLVIFRNEDEARRALMDSLFCGIIIGALHRLNAEYLSGHEFTAAGSLSKDFPPWLAQQAWFRDYPAVWAKLWLVSGLAPLFLLIPRKKLLWLVLSLTAVFSLVLYKVLFYGFFLLVPALLLWWPQLLHSRKERLAYAGGMFLFFLWYVAFRSSLLVYILSVAACVVPVALGLSRRWVSTPPFSSAFSLRRAAWGGLWLAVLLLPLFVPSIPPPFGLTQFSARETRFPPGASSEEDCAYLRKGVALRWGYRWRPIAEARCTLYRYR